MKFTYRILIRFNNEVDEHIGYGESEEDFFKILDRIHFMLNHAYLGTQCAILYIRYNNIVIRRYRINRTTVRYLDEYTI